MTKIDSIVNIRQQYETVIGIEVHVQLTSKTKIFCGTQNHVTKDPNHHICHICAGHPGVLPVLNKQVIDSAINAGLATNCTIATYSSFDRKHYFYPDLPKNYQITQQYEPICRDGNISIQREDGTTKKIRINRIHIEEDAGKSIHAEHSNESFVDLNRAGTPLLEIVSEPDISNSYEARAYLKSLRAIVQYLNICSGNMEEGAFRADTNISVHKKGASKFGTRCELKNINSFKYIGDAIEYEVGRQIDILENGGSVRQETRLWDTKTKQTRAMRSKEIAADYRYFPDPDLPIIKIDENTIEAARANLPELPHQKFERFRTVYGLSAYETDILIDDKELTWYFEETSKHTTSKQVINWVLRDLISFVHEQKIPVTECKITPEKLAALISMLENGTINNHTAKQVFATVAQTGEDPIIFVKTQGLEQVGATQELEDTIKQLILSFPEQATEYRSGKERLFGFFVGLAMQQTKGKGNPKIIQELLKKHLQ